ncbi:MAG: hypothetical protein J1E80_06205 [Desulfovibrionaceae bacterium]|nr:hypothetical protein [Desulfovibrionaceae bacterium]
MSISSIYNSSYSGLLQSLGISLNDADGTGSPGKSASGARSTSSSSALYSSGGSPENLAAALMAAMDDLNLSASDKITFQTLRNYRDQLQEKFTGTVRQELLEAGVDPDISFRLVSSTDGTGVKVISDHPDKDKVEQYFKDNPDMVKEFEKIQSLNKLEESRKSQNIDVKAIRSRIQMESMTTWFSDTSSMMAFSAQGAAYYSGINAIA